MAADVILFISIDNLRADCVGANPDQSAQPLPALPVRTPTLDALAAAGTFFQRCFAAASYTTTSHASMLTGTFPVRHQVREYYRHPLRADVATVFELFKRAGYATLLATDFPFLLGRNLGFTRAVDCFIDQADDEVVDWLRRHAAARALAFVHFGSVHNPFGLTSLDVDGAAFTARVHAIEQLAGAPASPPAAADWPERARGTDERHLRQRYFACTDALYASGRYADLMRLYVEGVQYFDGGRLARFVARLRDAGILDRALVVVTGDHGEEYSSRAFGHFNGLWEGIVNVPLLFLGDGIPRGVQRRGLCRTVDIVPTLLDLAGIAGPAAGCDGVSLAPMLAGVNDLRLRARGEAWFGHSDRLRGFMERCVVAGHLLSSPSFSTTLLEYLRDDEWKLILQTDLTTQEEAVSLFRIEHDRREMRNLAATYPTMAAALRDTIVNQRGAIAGTPIDLAAIDVDALRADLQDLGYLTE